MSGIDGIDIDISMVCMSSPEQVGLVECNLVEYFADDSMDIDLDIGFDIDFDIGWGKNFCLGLNAGSGIDSDKDSGKDTSSLFWQVSILQSKEMKRDSHSNKLTVYFNPKDNPI